MQRRFFHVYLERVTYPNMFKFCLPFFIFLFATTTLAQVDIAERLQVFNDKTKHDTIRVRAVEDVAWEYMYYSNLDSALKYALVEEEFARRIPDRKWSANAYNTIGSVYGDMGKMPIALKYYLAALSYWESKNEFYEIAGLKNNIGSTYTQLTQYDKAEKHLLDGINVCIEHQFDERLTELYVNYAGMLRQRGDREEGVVYYLKALDGAKKIEHPYMIAMLELNLASTYDLLHQDSLALAWYDRALESNLAVGDMHGLSTLYNNLGIYYNKKEDYKLGVKNCRYSYEIAKEISAHSAEYHSCWCLQEAFVGLKQYDSAFYYQALTESLEDTLLSESNIEEFTRLEMQFDFEKEQLADSLANATKMQIVDLEHEADLQREQKFKFVLYGGLAIALLIGGFIFYRLKVTNKQKAIIQEQKQKVDQAYEQLEEKNKEIMDSITYARRIQSAILPPTKLVKEYLKKSFILYKPKDIVAGDFYWMQTQEITPTSSRILFAVADCTGHGVPGALVSVVCNNALNRSVREYELSDPGQILDKTREIVISEFEKSDENVKDGMDIALCSLEGTILKFAGAHNPLWLIRKGELIEINANKQPIGKFETNEHFSTHTLQLEKDDSFYLFSDGYSDQFGGDKGKKFKSANFKKLLLSIQELSMDDQKIKINEAFEKWRGALEQLDDVCVIGVSI